MAIRGTLIYFFVISSFTASAQVQFERVAPLPPFPQITVDFKSVSSNYHAFGDIDNDGDLDVILTGSSDSGIISILYLNDGMGNYSDSGIELEAVLMGHVSFVDVNTDGNLDFLISGRNNAYNAVANLYLNNGNGGFVLDSISNIHGFSGGQAVFGDVNNDGFIDLITQGGEVNFVQKTRLYLNDGIGNLSLVSATPFEGLSQGTVNLSDIDNDGDLDVFSTGMNYSYDERVHLYLNDGTGQFSEAQGTPFVPVRQSAVATGDLNGDSYPDILVSGERNTWQQYTTTYYLNDGSGQFNIENNVPFAGMNSESLIFEDLDSDGILDVIIEGLKQGGTFFALYLNDGLGSFSQLVNPNVITNSGSLAAVADIDSDGDLDMLIAGASRTTWLYINDGAGNFDRVSQTLFAEVYSGDVAFSDIDNDGDMDVALLGEPFPAQLSQILYENDGNGNYTYLIEHNMPNDPLNFAMEVGVILDKAS